MKYIICIMTVFLLTALLGCTTSSNYNRGSLSDAMDKARDDYEDDREVPSDEKDDWPSDREEEDDYPHAEQEEIVTEDIDISGLILSLRGGTNFYSDPYFDSDFEGEALFGAVTAGGLFRFYFFGGLKVLQAQSDDSINQSIKTDAFQLNAGLEFRFYPLPKLKIFSPYLLARGGGYFLFWTYKNPLVSGSETISSDYIGGLLAGVGIGVDFIQGSIFSLGAQVIPELYLFGEETANGFTNDYFDSYGTIRVTVEAGYTF